MSWWDYGYQITGMSNRTVIVDNNTWNNTHIATVGKALVSPEKEAHAVATSLGANYVLVVFGGVISLTGDDLAKFLWFVRIAGGVFPEIKEKEYYKDGMYFGAGESECSDKLGESIAFKMMYNQFDRLDLGAGPGFDRAREVRVAQRSFELSKFKEVYTSSAWLVRIYEVLPPTNRAPTFEPFARLLFL